MANALETEFYREKLSTFEGLLDPLSISDLPFTYKSEVVSAGESAQLLKVSPFSEIVTGGTTAQSLVSVIGNREKSANREFFAGIGGRSLECSQLRGVRFADTHVTSDRGVDPDVFFHNYSIYGTGTFAHALKAIQRTLIDPNIDSNVTVLMAGERILRAFTHHAMSKFAGGVPNHLKYIFCYANYITPERRRWYEEFWGGRLIDRYGLTEVAGGASQDATTGWYFFDPIVYPEVVDPLHFRPLRDGIGMMVLTPLYPFQECQPLVRYWTDDVVSVSYRVPGHEGRLAIKPLGRRSDGVFDSKDQEWLLTPDVIFGVLDDADCVERTPSFQDSAQVLDCWHTGFPIYKLNIDFHDDQVVQVNISVALETKCASRLGSLNDIRERILSLSPALKLAMQERALQFSVTLLGRKQGSRHETKNCAS